MAQGSRDAAEAGLDAPRAGGVGLASSAPVQQQTDLNIGMHGASLRDRGFTVLSEPVMDPDLVERARTQSQDRLAALLQRVQDLGCDPFEQEYRFKEIAQRQRRRWDLQLQEPGTGDSNSTWAQLCRAALAAADPIIREAQGEAYCGTEPVMIGAVISWPGAGVQRWHSDADPEFFAAAHKDESYRLYNVFIPLVDVEQGSDGTEFWAATDLQDSTRALARRYLGGTKEASLPDVQSQIQSPACRAGGIILYDYRAIHRGAPNPEAGGRQRPVAYVLVSVPGGGRDTYNFPESSVWEDLTPEARAEFPLFRENQKSGRAAAYDGSEDSLDYYTELQGPDRYAIPIQFSCLKWGLGAGAANFFSKLARLVLSVEQALAR